MGPVPANIPDFLNLFSLYKIDSTVKFGVVWGRETGEEREWGKREFGDRRREFGVISHIMLWLSQD